MAGSETYGKPELAEEAALFFLRLVVAIAERKKAFQREFQHFFAQDLGLAASCRSAPSPRRDGDIDLFSLRIVKQPFFRGRALPPQTAALPDGELLSRACSPPARRA